MSKATDSVTYPPVHVPDSLPQTSSLLYRSPVKSLRNDTLHNILEEEIQGSINTISDCK